MANPLDSYSGKRGSLDVKVRAMPKLADYFGRYGFKDALLNYDNAMEVWRQELQRIFPNDETITNSITTIINNITQVAGAGSGSGETPPEAFDPSALIAQINALSDALAAHIAQIIVHGTSSPVVGETDEQILERKTIGFSFPRNAKFQHVIQVNEIVSGELFTVPDNYNMIVAGPFEIDPGGELIVEPTGNFAIVGDQEQEFGNVISENDLIEDELVVGAGGKNIKTKLSPGNPSMFLNGGSSPPDFALVKDSDLALIDTTANDVTTARHGFIPKAPGDAALFFRGDGIYAEPPAPPGGMTELTGDVTAGPGSGSQAATIANDAVTYAKMQDVSATDKLLGRSTAGSGNVEEIPCTAAGRALLDDATAAAQRTTLGLGTLATENTVDESDISLSDVTTNDVTSTDHGFAPKSPGDATKFLNGAATPAYAQVKDSDLSTSDITTNDVSTSKHGFAPKAPNDTSKFLNGAGAYTQPNGVLPDDFFTWRYYELVFTGNGLDTGQFAFSQAGTQTNSSGDSNQPPSRNFATAATTGTTAYFGCTPGVGSTLGIFPYNHQLQYWTGIRITETTTMKVFIGVGEVVNLSGQLDGNDVITSPSAVFRYSTGQSDANWKAVINNGSSSEVIDTGVAPDTAAMHKFEIRWDGTTSGKITFYIDGTLVATSTIDFTSTQNVGFLNFMQTLANSARNLRTCGARARFKTF